MKFALLTAAALAMPATDGPTFRVGLACDGPMPAVLQIEALRPGALILTLPDLMEACVATMPERARWRVGT